MKPHIEVRSKRVGGAAYQVPMQVSKGAAAVAGLSLDPDGGAGKEGSPDVLEIGRRIVCGVQAKKARP